jgi:hypothetical protein
MGFLPFNIPVSCFCYQCSVIYFLPVPIKRYLVPNGTSELSIKPLLPICSASGTLIPIPEGFNIGRIEKDDSFKSPVRDDILEKKAERNMKNVVGMLGIMGNFVIIYTGMLNFIL